MALIADNQAITNAINAICDPVEGSGYTGIALKFKTAGDSLIKELSSALGTFEGATKDALMASKIGAVDSETEGTLSFFVSTQLPNLVKGLSTLLEANRSTIEESDNKLAEAITSNGQG